MSLLAGFKSGGSRAPATGQPAAAAQARVRIDSRTYPLAALDRQKLVVDGYNGDLIPRQRFHFAFLLPIDGDTVEVPTRGVVLAIQDGRLHARYLAPQPYHQRLMRKAIDSLPFEDD
jgi:hypothetical protein